MAKKIKKKALPKKANIKTAKRRVIKRRSNSESDSRYVLKLALCMIVGSIWLRISFNDGSEAPIPIGFVVGTLFVAKDRFKLDRKIEYALLLAAMFIGFWLPIGLYIGV